MSPRRAALLILALSSLLIVAERALTSRHPLHRDLRFYAVVGHELLAGRELYSDLWDNRPPSTNVTFAIAEAVAGYGPRAIALLGLATALATLLGVYAAGRDGAESALGGACAALFWAIGSSDLKLEAHQPNTEAFINLTLAWGFAVLLRMRDDAPSRRRLAILAGALLALASTYKHFVIVAGALFAAVHVAFPPGRPAERRRAFGDAAWIGLTCLAIWAAMFGYFAATHRARVFFDAMITYNRFYAVDNPSSRTMIGNLVEGLRPGRWMVVRWPSTTPWLAVAALGAVASLRRHPREGALLLAWLAATQIAVSLPGRFYAHYYQLWLPPLAVGGGWAAAIAARCESIVRRRLACAAIAAVFAVLVARELSFYHAAGREGAPESAADIDLAPPAREIDELLEPGESFYNLGTEIGLYFLTRRDPPSGVLYSTDLAGNPLATTLSERVVADLERARPELVVMNLWVSELADRSREHPVVKWCLDHYRPLTRGPVRGGFVFLALRGGRVERRLSTAPRPLGAPLSRGRDRAD